MRPCLYLTNVYLVKQRKTRNKTVSIKNPCTDKTGRIFVFYFETKQSRKILMKVESLSFNVCFT